MWPTGTEHSSLILTITSLEKLKTTHPDRADEFERMKVRIGNSQKVIHNTYEGLINPYLMARKIDFENKLKSAVNSNPALKKDYGHVWDGIESARIDLTNYNQQLEAYTLNRFMSSKYFFIARDVVKFAEQMLKPEDERETAYNTNSIDSLKNTLFPHDFDPVLENVKLSVQADLIIMNLARDNELVQKLFGNYSSHEAVDFILKNSQLTSKESLLTFLEQDPEAILNGSDPFIYFIVNTKDKIDDLSKLAGEANDKEDVFENLLGRAMHEVYGTSIPPDANFTLRVSDGLMKSFDYNGTKTPLKTTFFGLYDRYYSFNKEYPWSLPERWVEKQGELDQRTPFNFITTNDIVGGNSGSAMINKNAEVVGLAFDGNVNSIVGNFIFMPKDNRCVGVCSEGILEALDKIYGAKNLSSELREGKINP